MAKARITIEIEIEEDGKIPAGTEVPMRVFRPGGRKALRIALAHADMLDSIGECEEAERLRESAWIAYTTPSKSKSFRIWD